MFRQLSGGGMVLMPFEQTFFARRFGMTTDRYGIGWMVSSGIDQCGDNIEGVRS